MPEAEETEFDEEDEVAGDVSDLEFHVEDEVGTDNEVLVKLVCCNPTVYAPPLETFNWPCNWKLN